jgi:hypothetical protein
MLSVPCKHWVLWETEDSSGIVFHAYRPTFMFLKGQEKVDLVRGANKAYVLYISRLSN